jgi:hypothetical protein
MFWYIIKKKINYFYVSGFNFIFKGTFEKISEPEEFKSKQIKRKPDDDSSQSSSKVKKKIPINDKSLVKIENYFQNSQKPKQETASSFQYKDNDGDILLLDEIKSSNDKDEIVVLNSIKANQMLDCPICFIKFSLNQIQNHVSSHFD